MKLIKMIFSRVTLIVIFFIAEILLLYAQFRWLNNSIKYLELILRLLSVLIVLYILKSSKHLSSDLVWIVLILIMPIFGTVLYIIVYEDLQISPTYRALKKSTEDAEKYYHQDPKVLEEVEKADLERIGQFRYISESAGFPIYENTGYDYYPLGDDGYPVILEELKKAEKFIFMEYFIIEEGQMWNGIHDILKEKVAQGVDVRVMYDDIGSLMTLSGSYAKQLEQEGIKCIPFNRLNPILGAILNHRDHRKILVIDGKVAFSGGINLADEYINVKVIHGHWKDNVIRVKGEAVWSFTVMFLTHWNAFREDDPDFEVYHVHPEETGEKDGWVAPYGETPLDDEIDAQNIYTGILNHAANYCWIMTPYLIIDSDLINALILAAKSGVDVKIITPGIPDKKIVYMVTRSYYHSLIEGGVKIYEYTPGFVHAKVFVSDDELATVGTVNLDYRSLYLHFENGTFLYGSKEVDHVKQDVLNTLAQCKEVTLEEAQNGPFKELLLSVMRLVTPMM